MSRTMEGMMERKIAWPRAPKKIAEVRRWMECCEAGGLELPKEVHMLDAYARLLEARIVHLLAERRAARKP